MLKRLEIILLVCGLLLTAGLAWLNADTHRTKANYAFERLIDEDVRRLDRRMQKYLQALIATGAYVRGSHEVTEDEFAQFVEDLNIEATLPGINGIGMIEAVQARDLPALKARMQAAGVEGFDTYPDTAQAEKLIIWRISPMSKNAEALGLDISFEEGRRTAAVRSRASNTPQLTPTITLVQDDEKQAGFLLLLPLDIDGADTWIYAPFTARALLGYDGANQVPDYVMQVYDGPANDPRNLIYESTQRFSADVVRDNPVGGQYRMTQKAAHFGRDWTLVFASTTAFEASYRDYTSVMILIGGFVLTVTLVAMRRNTRMRNTALAQIAVMRDRQIRSQEQQNRAIVDNAVTPVFILDRWDKVRFANQAACTLFDYTEDQINGFHFEDLVVPPAEGRDYATGVTRTGDALLLDLQRNEWTTEEGAKRVTAIVRDITAERNAHRAILHTKTQYDMALQGSRIGVFNIDLEKGTSEVSDTWCMIMGYEIDHNQGDKQEDFLSRVHPDDVERLKAADAACIAGVTDRSLCEYRLRVTSGEWRWMRSDAIVSKWGPDGRALRLLGTQVDVTKEHQARNTLEASESRFRQILAGAPVGTVILDRDGAFVGSNQAFCRLVDVTEGDLETDHTMHDFLSPKDMETLYMRMSERAEEGTTEPYKAEFQLQRREGPPRLGLFHVSWSFNKNTQNTFLIVQIIDVTEQRRVDKLKDEFVSTVSHELRTPLTSIKGALGLLDPARAAGDSKATERLIEIASTNADRLAAIVNDILDLEKISTGDLAFDVESIDLSALITSAADVLQPFAAKHDNTLVLDLPKTPLMVQADTLRLQQVIENLMSNACKYSHVKTPVTVFARHQEDMAIVRVSNVGDGIPKDFQPHLFAAFSQADGSDTRAKGGTGLGLNISRQIVDRHGGQIGFDSAPGGVTEFWFTCPLTPNGPTPKRARKPAPAPRGNERPLVLHLEDDADFAEIIRAGLAPFADVVHVSDMGSAGPLISDLDLDAIILDWGLPDGDASTMLERVKRRQPGARIIGLSADADRAKDARVNVNIVKTRVDMPQILNVILDRDPHRGPTP